MEFHKQMEDREREWTAINGTLREQIASLTQETSQKIESLQGIITGLDNRKPRSPLTHLPWKPNCRRWKRAHAELTVTLKTREASLRKELDVKNQEWKAVQDALQEQLAYSTAEAAKKSETQQARISVLETQSLEAQSEAKVLQQKLHHVEQERAKLVETLQKQETTLRKEFEEKHREWSAAQEALQLDYTTLSKNAVQKQEAYQAQLSDLETAER